MVLRWSFSLSLIFVGLTHYMQIDSFRVMVTDGLGPFAPLGMLWAFVLPALFIVGGVLLLIGKYMDIGVWATAIGLGSIPAGMLLKPVLSGMSLSDTMPPAIQAFIWLLVFMWVVKLSSCGPCDCGPEGKTKNGMKK